MNNKKTVKQRKFYDEGINAYVRGEPYSLDSSRDWRDGWKDARELKIDKEVE